jgi:hypothetical protein
MGFADNSRAWRYYKPETRQVLKSRNVVFVPESGDYGDLGEAELPEGEQLPLVAPQAPPTQTPGAGPSTPPKAPSVKVQPTTPPRSKAPPPPKAPVKGSTPRFTAPPPPRRSGRTKTAPDYARMDRHGLDRPDNDQRPAPWHEEREAEEERAHRPIRMPGGFETPESIPTYPRADKGKQKAESSEEEAEEADAELGDLESEWHEYAYSAVTRGSDEDHPDYKETLERWDSDEWAKARDIEMTSLHRMGTFDLVERPKGARLLDSRWVHAVKRDADGEVTRYRARLVLRGFAQRYGVDFSEVFAHVLRSDTLRVLLALATIHDWDVHTLDVVGAFLNGRVEEEIYMKQVPGYEDGTNKVLRLIGSLYGLKQAPRIWNETFRKEVVKVGYIQAKSDPSLFTRITDTEVSILAVYVDDIAVFTDKNRMPKVKKELMSLFEMRDMGEIRHFLGYRITRDRRKKTTRLTQDTYIRTLVERAGLSEANATKLPMTAGTQYQRYEGPRIDFPYATHIGGLLYASLGTRPDIAYAVQHLSQFSSNPGPEHIAGVKSLLRYLKGTVDCGITYSGAGHTVAEIVGFSDADWGANILDRKSISGQVFMLAGGAVTWTSKKQPTIALSSLEAEYLALSLCTRQAIWIIQLLDDVAQHPTPYLHQPPLGRPDKRPFTILCDNAAAVALAHDPQYHGRSKHIDVRHHFLRRLVATGVVHIEKVSGEDNLADALTKALPGARFASLTRQVMDGGRLAP